jgi:hypothetical protein
MLNRGKIRLLTSAVTLTIYTFGDTRHWAILLVFGLSAACLGWESGNSRGDRLWPVSLPLIMVVHASNEAASSVAPSISER